MIDNSLRYRSLMVYAHHTTTALVFQTECLPLKNQTIYMKANNIASVRTITESNKFTSQWFACSSSRVILSGGCCFFRIVGYGNVVCVVS